MNKQHEILKLQALLRIPISDIVFHETYVDIVSAGLKIGALPYYSLSGILSYDTSDGVINRLNWLAVYNKSKEEINSKVQNLLATSDTSIAPGKFRRLYIRNHEGTLIGSVICVYDQDWNIYNE